MEEIFKNKDVKIDKLLQYGFVKEGQNFVYKSDLLNGEFELFVTITPLGDVSTRIFDKKSQEEYVLYRLKDAVGEFVGKIREAAQNVLLDICDKCYSSQPFKGKQTNEIISYIKTRYGDDLEFLWENFPTDAIWRRKDNRKWYGLLMAIERSKLGLESDEIVEVLNLRILPEDMQKVVDNKSIFVGYHMNKKHWFSICLDGTVNTKRITKFIDDSYILAKKK